MAFLLQTNIARLGLLYHDLSFLGFEAGVDGVDAEYSPTLNTPLFKSHGSGESRSQPRCLDPTGAALKTALFPEVPLVPRCDGATSATSSWTLQHHFVLESR